jgi:hypothetical protein
MGTPTRLSVAATAALLAACATPYKPDSALNQGGYGEQRRAPGVFEVWFRGNHYTSEERSHELAVLRAAELCLGENKPFMRTSHFQSTSYLDDTMPGNSLAEWRLYTPWSGLKVECLAERSGDAQEAAVVAATIRERYGIATRSAPRTPQE